MFGKFKSLIWYMRRPRLFPHMIYSLTNKIFRKRSLLNNTKEEMSAWCKDRAVDTGVAIKSLTGKAQKYSIHDHYFDIFDFAHRKVASCPVKMGGAGNIDLIYWLAEQLSAIRVVETGVASGWSSLAFLLSLNNRTDAKLMSTDMPYIQVNNDEYVGCVVPDELRSNLKIFRYSDRQALPKALNEIGTIDMCHYDSAKSYEARMWAYPLLWQALRHDGIFLSDDIGDNVAFRDFAESINEHPTVVEWENKYIGILVKHSFGKKL